MSDHRRSSAPTLNSTVWLAVAAAAGLVAGVMLSDKLGGRKKLMRRVSGVLRAIEAWAAVDEDDEGDEDEEEYEDSPDRDYADAGEDDAEDDGDEPDADEYEDEEEEEDDDDIERDEDERIDARVLAAFEQDPVLSQRAIEIDEPEPATIVLSGRVPSHDDAVHAVTIARGVPGVLRIEDRLRVRVRTRPSPATRTDA